MASSMKTPNLNLTQFEDTDNPSWLTDYNNDMMKIDSKAMQKTVYDANGEVETAGGIASFAMPKAAYDANGEVAAAGGIASYTATKAPSAVFNSPITAISGITKPSWVNLVPTGHRWGRVGQMTITTGITAGFTANATNVVCTLPAGASGTGTFIANVDGNMMLGGVNGRDVWIYLPSGSLNINASVSYFITAP